MTVKLVADSTSYIQEETLRDLDIKIVSLAVNFPGESFDEESADYDDFINELKERDYSYFFSAFSRYYDRHF